MIKHKGFANYANQTREYMLEKEDFHALKTKQIKSLLTADVPIEYLLWGQEDPRKSVRDACAAYIRRQQRLLAEKQRIDALYTYESTYYKKGIFHIAGIDEVGRGPIAGPVTVAAVILPTSYQLEGINDSKKLSHKKREMLYDKIMKTAVSVSVVSYSSEQIDSYNIYQATRLAMYEAINDLSVQPEAVLVDAMPLPKLTIPHESLIKGDSKSASIAAASIIAKVIRDRYMEEIDNTYPEYGFKDHKGYFTEAHKRAIEHYGPCPIHRRIFEPVKSMVASSED